ncbi:MAG: amidohydrolase [Ruminococcus sp.]|nr:amidohydrolase [Ruminococcus sp.]
MNILIKNTEMLVNGDISKGDIFIGNGKILSVGKEPENFTADKTVDGGGKLAVPGLINCHTHSYMSLFRNIADDLSFEDWLFGNIMPREDRLTAEDGYWGAMLSCAEMIKSGTTCFMDMHMFPKMTAKAADTLGMRAVMTRGLTGSSRNDKDGIRRVNEHFEEMEAFKDNSRISFKMGAHAIYTCGGDYLEWLIEKASETGQEFHIHLSETVNEVDNCQKEHGCSPVEYLNGMGFFDIRTCAAHCVHLSERDMDILAEKKVSVIHNPKSNLKLANGTAPVSRMLEKGINICLGTDSQASNNSLNMFSEMNYAALLQKGATAVPTVCPASRVFDFATVNGAKALGIPDIGEIKAGYRADIVMLDLGRPQFYPRNDLTAALVYSANGSEADTVLIDGEIVLENGRLTKFDEEEIYGKVQEAANRL